MAAAPRLCAGDRGGDVQAARRQGSRGLEEAWAQGQAGRPLACAGSGLELVLVLVMC